MQRVIEVGNPGLATERVRLFLARMYGFQAPLERRLLTRTDLAHLLPDLAQRRKADRIAHDLDALGVPREDADDLPRCGDLPDLPDVAAALGCIYVLEVTPGAAEPARAVLPRELAARSRYLAAATSQTGSSPARSRPSPTACAGCRRTPAARGPERALIRRSSAGPPRGQRCTSK